MSYNKSKKQTRALYACFVIMLITAMILTVVTSTSNKSRPGGESVSPSEQSESGTDLREPSKLIPDKLPGIKGGDADETEQGSGEKEKAGLVTDAADGENVPEKEKESDEAETEKTGAEPENVSFTLPADGGVINAHSLKVPTFSPTMNDYRTHAGVDVRSEIGGEVRAAADGAVEEIWEDPMMGWSMRVSHPGGFESVYRNLSPDFPEGIESGAAVTAGQTIAAVGSTALIECEEEPHLHFELRLAGESVDPAEYMGFESVSAEFED